jgi:hypothetical protein
VPLPAVRPSALRNVSERLLHDLDVRLRPRPRRGATRRDDVVVSLTSYPARMPTLWLTVASLLRQDVQPRSVLLTLSADEFPGRQVPDRLARMADAGVLRIRFEEGNRCSYKKLLPALAEEGDRTIVTADDDVLYPRWWLARLLDASAAEPGLVIAYRALAMVLADGDLAPYGTWHRADPGTDPRLTLPTGRDGVLYPAGALDPRVHDYATAARLCPTADDVWFKAMALARGTGARALHHPRQFPSSRADQAAALYRVNADEAANDPQLRAVLDELGLWDRLPTG